MTNESEAIVMPLPSAVGSRPTKRLRSRGSTRSIDVKQIAKLAPDLQTTTSSSLIADSSVVYSPRQSDADSGDLSSDPAASGKPDEKLSRAAKRIRSGSDAATVCESTDKIEMLAHMSADWRQLAQEIDSMKAATKDAMSNRLNDQRRTIEALRTSLKEKEHEIAVVKQEWIKEKEQNELLWARMDHLRTMLTGLTRPLYRSIQQMSTEALINQVPNVL